MLTPVCGGEIIGHGLTGGIMNLRTSLHLSAVFPFFFAIVIVVSLRWLLQAVDSSGFLSAILLVLTGVLGFAMALVILYYIRVYFKKISTLNEWTDAVLKGDLDVVVDIKASD